jgi:hypothetical protein
MMELIARLGEKMGTKRDWDIKTKFTTKIHSFEQKTGFLLPPDLAEYFIMIDKTAGRMDTELYEFYAIDQFESIKRGLAHWGGVPNYRNIVNTLDKYENCFVFADYMMHSFTYAIRLHPDTRIDNDIYVISGDKYKVIANSFSGFLHLYFDESLALQMG